ncbi:MAG: YraN family protein [Deltaproteobacteria bacterium]|nr:YraN family protein [Deltaproteobacteria bacterium]
MPRTARQVLGAAGEQAAEALLAREGYVVLARNYRWPGGEADLVALDGLTVVFVEVKTRCNEEFGTPFEAVTWRQRRRISRTAQHFLLRHHLAERAVRFDVVGVWMDDGRLRCELIRGAFDGVE